MSVKEEWKEVEVPGRCDFKIEVSSLGQVRKTSSKGVISILQGTVSSGFRYVNFAGYSFAVHKMVAEAFVPNPNNYYKVIHKNGDKTDCRAENLAWAKHFIRRESNMAEINRIRVYCSELDQVFGSLKTAAYITMIPQDVISWGILNNKSVFGLTFSWIEPDCEISRSHDIIYISSDKMYKLAENSSSIEDLKNKLETITKRSVVDDNKKE